VANFPVDDGQDLGSLEVAHSGTALAFVRGQGYNRWRENPNPSSDPDGSEQAVWVVTGCRAGTAACAAARRIGRGWAPRLSPDGRRVLYQLDSTLMIAPTSGATAPRPLFEGRGVNADARWSPDGRMVAFTSTRDDHSFVGVYDITRDSIRWMSPGVDRDGNARWSPDGKRLAFIRTAGGPTGGNVFAPRAGTGFGIMLADPADGSVTEIWHSVPDVEGRLRVPTAGEFLLWSGSHLVFFSEADGWQHLYAIQADGSRREPAQLTKGECEVEEPSATADGATIYYSANCGDIDRKHIWRVSVGGGEPVQVTRGERIEYAPAVSGRRLLFLRADARRPPAPVLMTLEGREVALAGAPSLPSSFPAEQLVEPQQVTFTAEDGLTIHGQLFVPPDAKRAPAVIFMHGGPPRQMLLGWHPRGYYNRAYGMNQYLASRGYVVLSVNYRLGVGYGRAFREAERGGRRGASEYQDIVAGGRYLQRLPYVDSTRIGLWGGSYGGYLTAYGMAKNPELFKVGVDLHGVHDWNARFSNFAPAATAGSREADSVLAIGRASSPICCVSTIAGPILFIHGDDDRNVSFSETVNFIQLLRAEKKPHEVLVLPDEVHDFLRHTNWLTAYRASAEFFDRHLMRARTAEAEGANNQ
jgi:dipeptidyl aminopeptidase/acylaminoacyl peptidase